MVGGEHLVGIVADDSCPCRAPGPVLSRQHVVVANVGAARPHKLVCRVTIAHTKYRQIVCNNSSVTVLARD